MQKNYKDHIESFSVDYREGSLPVNRSGSMRPVTGRSMPIKKEKSNIKKEKAIKVPQRQDNILNKRENETVKYDVYINAKPKGSYRGLMVALTVILTVVGIGIFVSTLNKASVMTSETVNYNSFNGFLYPVVMQDPAAFSEPKDADKCMVISSSIWMTIFRNKAESYNSFDEQGYALLPISEIKESCAALFGSEDLLNFSETIHGPFFYYNPGEDKLHVGAISNQGRPLPQIKDVKEEDNQLTFTVDYVLMGAPEEDLNQRDVIKTMIYNMRLNENTDKYYIYSVEPVG